MVSSFNNPRILVALKRVNKQNNDNNSLVLRTTTKEHCNKCYRAFVKLILFLSTWFKFTNFSATQAFMLMWPAFVCLITCARLSAVPVHVERMMQWSILGLQLTVISRQWWALWCCADLSSGLNWEVNSSRGQTDTVITDNTSSYCPPTTSTLDSPCCRF